MLENIGRRLAQKNRSNLKIEIQNWSDPDGGSISMTAVVKDAYSGNILLELSWYYDFAELMAELDKKIMCL